MPEASRRCPFSQWPLSCCCTAQHSSRMQSELKLIWSTHPSRVHMVSSGPNGGFHNKKKLGGNEGQSTEGGLTLISGDLPWSSAGTSMDLPLPLLYSLYEKLAGIPLAERRWQQGVTVPASCREPVPLKEHL